MQHSKKQGQNDNQRKRIRNVALAEGLDCRGAALWTLHGDFLARCSTSNEKELSDRRRMRAVLRIPMLKSSKVNFHGGQRFAPALG